MKINYIHLVIQLKVIFLSLLAFAATGQNFAMERIAYISDEVQESSGMLFYNGRIITHNDSGGEPVLYELDSVTGNVIRTVTISNSTNIDWEEITQDDQYIYIGDFGNQSGNRQDLKIYRISKADYLNNNSTIQAESILFSYSDQTSFAINTYRTNYDAEAFIAEGDSLYIFTKNWSNLKTYVYSLPKVSGTYAAEKIDSLNVQGLITAATVNATSRQIALLGYSTTGGFIWEISGGTGDRLFGENRSVHFIENSPNLQLEGICINNAGKYLVSSETYGNDRASIYRLSGIINGIAEGLFISNIELFPNPASTVIHIPNNHYHHIQLINSKGETVLSSEGQNVDISMLSPGVYLVKLLNEDNGTISLEKLLVE